jgi:hypothetical protein
MTRKLFLLGALLLVVAALAACSGGATTGEEATPCPTAEPCPDCPTCPEPEGPTVAVPFEEAWAGSGHADAAAEAFTHWDEEDPQEVPAECAKCHSTPGALDFYGVDGSAAGTVDAAAPIGTVVTCEACHNAGTVGKTSVVFPSGAEVTGLGNSARCMECHQGRSSGATVDQALADLGLAEDLDTVSADLGFINIHYFAAAASLFGSEAHGGYEYAGSRYQIRFAHVEGYQECVDCHNPHTLELNVEQCSECHIGVASAEDLRNVRMAGSLADYDGDGDVSEGVAFEIEGMQAKLMGAIQAYAAEVSGTPIVYDSAAYPYFFIDTDGNGEVTEGEAAFPNRYNAWTGRLLRAAYNYQVSVKDPGAFAHNAKYHIALLYDSILSLNEVIATPVDLSTASRNDAGHFDGTAEAFRHWDEEENVPGRCARCHSADGLPTFFAEATNIGTEQANAFMCTTCHTFEEEPFALLPFEGVTFPSGAKVALEDAGANLCMQCHQGRESTVSVDRAIAAAGVADNAVTDQLSFRNVHYFAAGATLFGSEARGAYEYAGKTYVGRNVHVPAADSCVECHNVHALEVQVESCAACHGEGEPATFRIDATDWDGDGDTTEGVAGEIDTMATKLFEAIQAYASTTTGTVPIVYNPAEHPYFFDEAGERYVTWTPALLRAAYNYQYSQKDPGAFAHNSKYVMQVLYDSIQAIGGDVTGMTRP